MLKPRRSAHLYCVVVASVVVVLLPKESVGLLSGDPQMRTFPKQGDKYGDK